MKLAVAEAQIHTASVEVKTLTISGKQVTLAVFKQLKEGAMSADNIDAIWGQVNYCPGRNHCSGDAWHIHVVYQEGAELRRAAVSRPGFDRRRRQWEFLDGEWPEEYRSEVAALWERILNVPQLFIAV